MVEAMQEELGRMSQQLIRGILTPDTLAPLMKMMQQSLGAMGFDMGRFAGMMGQQPGFDAYKILGLDRSASNDEVKRRYRELLHVLHPDKSGTPGTGLFLQMVMAAFELIKKERGCQ
jgi:DnaJ-class molecular chaperone